MSRLVSFALFFSIMLTVLGGVHFYLWARLIRDISLPPAGQWALTLGLVFLYLSIPLSFFVRRTGAAWSVPVVWVSSIWMGVFFLAFVVLVAMMFWFQVWPSPALVLAPLFLAMAFVAALGVSLFLTALNVRYRDVPYAIPFLMQIWLFLSGVV